MDSLADRLSILKEAIEVGLLDVHGGDVIRQHLLQCLRIGLAVFCWHHAQLVVGAEAVGAHGIDGIGMRSGGDQRYTALPVAAHGGGLGCGGGAVVDGGIAHGHSGQRADHGLVFKNGLQNALTDLGLIRRVSGEKFLLGGDILDNAGDVVVVGAGAAQDHGEHPVLRGHGGHGPSNLHLAHPGRNIQRMLQVHAFRHIAVQLPVVAEPDGLQHLLPLGRSGRHVASHLSPPRRRKPRKRRRPSAPHCH